MRISVETNFPEVQRKLDSLRADVAEKALARAVNRTIEQAQTAMVRSITAEYNLLARDVRKRLSIKRASYSRGIFGIYADLFASGNRAANLIRFGAMAGAKGVTAKVRKTGGRKTYHGTFIGNKGRTVFERVPGTTMRTRSKYSGTKHAEQIRPVYRISIPQMFNARKINAAVVRVMQDKFPAIFERESAYYAARFNR